MSNKKTPVQLLKTNIRQDDHNHGDLFWVEQAFGLKSYSASELLNAFEEGEFTADTLVRIKREASSKPLRKYLKELVWIAYQKDSEDLVETNTPSLFEVVFQNAPIGIVLSDLAGRIQYANEAFCHLVDYHHEELIGKGVGEISDISEREDEQRLGNELLSGQRLSFQLEKGFITKDGQRISTLLSVSIVRDLEGRPMQVAAHVVDLTSYNQLQHKLAQAERLKTVGRLAGAIAHDFNNLLAVVLGLTSELSDSKPAIRKEAIHQISEAAHAASRLTKYLLTYSNKGKTEAEVINLNQTLLRLKPILRGSLGQSSELVYHLHSEPLLLKIDPIQLEQVFMNLSFNAIKAMSEGDTLTISTEDKEERVCLSVSDTGCGMSKEVQERAFEPFFTTKHEAGGTGLGLSTVHNVVQRFNGEVQLKSELGVGTSISIFWPKIKINPSEKQSEATAHLTEAEFISAHILIVDDQPAILAMISRALKKSAYSFRTATCVQEAVQCIREAQEPFHLLLCDIQLPDGDGREVADVLRDIWPSSKVLFMSGYSVDTFQNPLTHQNKVEMIQKPFLPSQIQKRINQILKS